MFKNYLKKTGYKPENIIVIYKEDVIVSAKELRELIEMGYQKIEKGDRLQEIYDDIKYSVPKRSSSKLISEKDAILSELEKHLT